MDYKKVRTTGAIPLPKLKKLFGVEKKYPTFGRFNQAVLQLAMEEINAPKNNTGINLTMQQIKIGRKVTGIKFLIKSMVKEKKIKREDPDLITVDPRPDYNRMAYEQRLNATENGEDQVGIAWANFETLSDADKEAKWQQFENEEVKGNMFLRELGRDNSSMLYSFKNWLIRNL